MAYDVEAPKYVRLAQTLQGRIEDGTYAPGTRVPSENQLVQAFGMSRPTVVRALELLKRDGWLESRQGYGTIVRGRPAVVEEKDRRGSAELTRDESRVPGRLVEVGRVAVPARVASVLGLPKRAKVLMRRFLVEEDGEPVELVSSYFPAGLIEGTELESAAPWWWYPCAPGGAEEGSVRPCDGTCLGSTAGHWRGSATWSARWRPCTQRPRHRARCVGPGVAGL